MNNQTIGIMFGSRSPEHEVSIITGQLAIHGLKELNKYNIMPIYLSKQGKWYLGPPLDSLKFFQSPDKDEKIKKLKEYHLDLNSSQNKLVFKQKGLAGKQIEIDLAFPAFHGQHGEDGTIQGLFEMFNIPYVGCDVTSSALTMDKVLTKLIYQAQNIPTTKFVHFETKNWADNKQQILEKINRELTWPLIIKPARLGSSIGITKAENQEKLEHGIEVGLHYDDKVLVENCVENLMDLTCCVIGNQEPQASLIQETLFKDEVYSYKDKYISDGGTHTGKAADNVVIPANLGDETTKKIQELSVEIFKLFGCSGIARVDFLYNKETKEYFANEANTLPGTFYHHLWDKSGIKFTDLLDRLIQYAQEKHTKKQKLTFTFDSDILQQDKSAKLQLKETFG